jgi:hypothetical protein
VSAADRSSVGVEGCARLGCETNVEKTTMAVGADARASTKLGELDGLLKNGINANEAAPQPQGESFAAPLTAKRFSPTGTSNALSEPHSVHTTFPAPKPPLVMRPTSCAQDDADSWDDPEPVPRQRPRLDGTPEASRAAWEAFYARKDGDSFSSNPFLAEASAALAITLFPPSVIAMLEGRLGLQPADLASGRVTVLRMVRRSMQVEATIYDPLRKRHVSALVDLFAPEDLAALADALRLLKEWQEPKAKGDSK